MQAPLSWTTGPYVSKLKPAGSFEAIGHLAAKNAGPTLLKQSFCPMLFWDKSYTDENNCDAKEEHGPSQHTILLGLKVIGEQ